MSCYGGPDDDGAYNKPKKAAETRVKKDVPKPDSKEPESQIPAVPGGVARNPQGWDRTKK